MDDFSLAGRKVLVVDDLEQNVEVLRRFLEPMGFEVHSASHGEEAIEVVNASPPDVLLLDLVMPGMDGFEVCRRLKRSEQTRHIPVIIITGVSDKQANVDAVDAGADDFLTKPFDKVLLEARIRSSIRAKLLQDRVLAYQQELEMRVAERTKQLELSQHITVFSLAKLSESRDVETGDHLERIRSYARELADELALWPKYHGVIRNEFVEELYHSSPLHDIGKVGIPDRILLKPGKLTTEEFEIMKTHTLIGGDTLRAADMEAGRDSFLAMGRDIAYYHHEKYDGSGYPYGMGGGDIPLPARIVALADVYDALSSKRPYKEPFDHETSRKILLEGRGKHFDPDVVDAFLKREERFLYIRQHFQGTGRLAPIQRLVEAIEEKDQQIQEREAAQAQR
ncbi:MAG: response regulator [Candidatus Hydrogenedentes bacterium]|nr:response regulator [Candidatus Hydrogenedentota bacterium]